MNIEKRIRKENNLLLLSDVKEEQIHDEIMVKFCGRVVINSNILELNSNMFVYLCGNIEKLAKLIEEKRVNYENLKVYIIKEYSYSYNQLEIDYDEISIGEVPLNYHDVGIYFRNFFDNNFLFDNIEQEHEFQELTESNKPNKALRTGLYITHIKEDEKSQLHFNLLRCSSNFAGSTDNFRETDLFILDKLNRKCNELFEQSVNLNHVLAQIYHNKIKENKKATIKEHSDKTKDMPRNGLNAFCTFYKNIEQQPFSTKSNTNTFDYCYKETSVLTRLYFKLKPQVEQNYVKEFYVTLYPNSVFLIPLSTNRMYICAHRMFANKNGLRGTVLESEGYLYKW